MNKTLIATFALTLPVMASPAYSQKVYRCVDLEGKVHYQSSSCSGTGKGTGGRVSLTDNGKVQGANDPLPDDLQGSVERLEQAEAARRQAAAERAAQQAATASSAPSPDQQQRQQEAQKILDNLPYGKPGDKAKRESMLEHARILMNADDGPAAQEAEKVLSNMPYGTPGDRTKRDAMLEHARILTGQSTGAPPERPASPPTHQPPPIPQPAPPQAVTVRSSTGDSTQDYRGWRDPNTGQVQLNNSQNPGMPLRGQVDPSGNGQVKDIYGNPQQVRGGKIIP